MLKQSLTDDQSIYGDTRLASQIQGAATGTAAGQRVAAAANKSTSLVHGTWSSVSSMFGLGGKLEAEIGKEPGFRHAPMRAVFKVAGDRITLGPSHINIRVKVQNCVPEHVSA